jgi:hypothetical protein
MMMRPSCCDRASDLAEVGRMTDGLFDLPADYTPPPPPETLTRGERRQRLIARRITSGEHPLGKGIRLHPDAARERDGEGLRCGSCRYRELFSGESGKSYPKCLYPTRIGDHDVRLRFTHCESSDIRTWWPACVDYQPKDKKL